MLANNAQEFKRERVDLFNFLRGDAGTKQVHLGLRIEPSTMTNHKKKRLI